MIFTKYIIDHKIAKFKYFAKVITYSKSLDHVPQTDIQCVHIQVFDFLYIRKWSLLIKVAKSKYFSNI